VSGTVRVDSLRLDVAGALPAGELAAGTESALRRLVQERGLPHAGGTSAKLSASAVEPAATAPLADRLAAELYRALVRR
jgi:hypothetical protein